MLKIGRGEWFVRVDLTVIHGINVLLGFNYVEGVYTACKDETLEDCIHFDYAEFQIGLLIFTIAIGKESLRPPMSMFKLPIFNEQRDQDNTDVSTGSIEHPDEGSNQGRESEENTSTTSYPGPGL